MLYILNSTIHTMSLLTVLWSFIENHVILLHLRHATPPYFPLKIPFHHKSFKLPIPSSLSIQDFTSLPSL